MILRSHSSYVGPHITGSRFETRRFQSQGQLNCIQLVQAHLDHGDEVGGAGRLQRLQRGVDGEDGLLGVHGQRHRGVGGTSCI
jgi:hypothetical protein